MMEIGLRFLAVRRVVELAVTRSVKRALGPDAMRARVQRRAVPTLAAAQVLGGVGVAAGLAVGGLLAEQISSSTARAGLAATMSVLGAALLAVPMARLAQRFGRRMSLASGPGVGAGGALGCVLAAQLDRFGLLLAGALLFGGGTASGLQARFAAVDAASPSRRRCRVGSKPALFKTGRRCRLWCSKASMG